MILLELLDVHFCLVLTNFKCLLIILLANVVSYVPILSTMTQNGQNLPILPNFSNVSSSVIYFPELTKTRLISIVSKPIKVLVMVVVIVVVVRSC